MIYEEPQPVDWERIAKITPIPYTDVKKRDFYFCVFESPNLYQNDVHGTVVVQSILDFLRIVEGMNVLISDPKADFLKLIPDKLLLSQQGHIIVGDFRIMLSSYDWTVINFRKGNVWGTILRTEDDEDLYTLKSKVLNLFDAFKDNGFEVNRLLSPPKMAEQVIRKNVLMSNIPNLSKGDIPENVIQASVNCFRGGRMEAISLGTFDQVVDYDVVRAYFSVLKRLPSLNPGFVEWRESKEFIEEALFGFCQCRIKTPEEMKLGPLAVRFAVGTKPHKTYYPTGEHISWRTKREIELIRNTGIGDVEILYGVWCIEKRQTPKPFKGAAKIIEKLMNDPRSSSFARYMSSTSWGKFASLMSCLYNPVYAGFTTSEIRCLTTEKALTSVHDIIAISVDGLSSVAPILSIKSNNEIGGFREEIIDQMLSVADFYRYTGEGKVGWSLDDKGVKIKTRTPTGAESEINVPYGSSKRMTPSNLSLRVLSQNQFKLNAPSPEDVVELYFSKNGLPGMD